MKTKHTPGPWEITDGHNKAIFVEGQQDEWERLFCEVSTDDCCKKTAQANARLIAAAPELLEALTMLLQTSEWADETGYVEDVGFVDLEEVQEKARAAINKATL